MKLYGYTRQEAESDDITPSELAEITLVADAEELREIAQFLIRAADGMDLHGSQWQHEHLGDIQKRFEHDPHFVVFNPAADDFS